MEDRKTILISGASGFLGRHLILSLKKNYNIVTLGRTTVQNLRNIHFDFGNQKQVDLPQVDIVIHAAGKAHMVPKSIIEEEEFFQVNVEGTKQLLMSLSVNKPHCFIFISSISVYGLESGLEINEEYKLSASDPYGLSKIQAENNILSWGENENVKVGILRLPLLIGKDAPGNFGAMVNAIKNGRYLNIGRGEARKSMVLAGDVAAVIPQLSSKGGVFNLTDGHHPSFCELSKAIAFSLNKDRPRSIKVSVLKLVASVGDILHNTFYVNFPLNSYSLKKMTTSLTFDDSKARKELNWNPSKVLEAIKDCI